MSEIRRYVANGRFISETDPPLILRLPAGFHYLGRTDFILEDAAHIDRHHFVDGAAGTVDRLIVLHFEHLLPDNPTTINYRMPTPPADAGPNYRFTLSPVRLGQHDYMHNTWFYPARPAVEANPHKELARTARLLAEHGYALPAEIQMTRYVRILDETRKSELILFYMEPLANTGFSAADFVAGGAGAAMFDDLSAALTARGRAVFQIESGQVQLRKFL